jgi:hypothetical protein
MKFKAAKIINQPFYSILFRILIFSFFFGNSLFGQAQKTSNKLNLNLGFSNNYFRQVDGNPKWQGGMYGFNFGVSINDKLFGKFYLLSGLGYNFQSAKHYENEVLFYTNWVDGIEETNVKLNTQIKFHELNNIWALNYKTEKFLIGTGILITYLLNASFDQVPIGNYYSSQHSDTTFNQRVYNQLTFESENLNSPFKKFNFSPLVVFGYQINERIGIQYLTSYDLFSNPQLNFKFGTYNLLRNNFILTLNINNF